MQYSHCKIIVIIINLRCLNSEVILKLQKQKVTENRLVFFKILLRLSINASFL